MANKNDINIGVNIDSKGMGQLEKGSARAAGSMGDLNKKKNEYNRLEKGSAQLSSNSTKNFAKMNQVVGGGLVPAYAVLAANIFAVSAAFNALRTASQMKQLEEGVISVGRASGQNLTMLSSELQNISGNALSAAQSMEAVALGASAGFDSSQLKNLTTVAKGASLALGRNLPDSIDRLVRGAAKLEPEILDELGIMVRLDSATANYALSVGKTAKELSQFERRQAFVNEIIEQGTQKFGALADEMDANPYDTLSAAFQDLSKSFLNAINVISPVISFFSSNMLLMAGSTAAFSAGIVGQMIPSLTEGGNELAKQAKGHADYAKSQLASLKGVENAPKLFRENADAMAAGTLSAKKEKAAINSASASLRMHTTQLENQAKKYKEGTIAGDKKRATIKGLQGALGSYAAAQAAATIAEELNTIATYQNAAAQGSLNGMLVAGKSIVLADLAATKAAAVGKGLFATAVIYTNGALATMGTLLKGVAILMLKTLPMIGLAVGAIGLLYMGFQKLRDMSMTDLDRTLESVGERLQEFPNIMDKTIERIMAATSEWAAFGAGIKSAAGVTNQLSGMFKEIVTASSASNKNALVAAKIAKANAMINSKSAAAANKRNNEGTPTNMGPGQAMAAYAQALMQDDRTEIIENSNEVIARNGEAALTAAEKQKLFIQSQQGLINAVGNTLSHFTNLQMVTTDNANLQTLYAKNTKALEEALADLATANTPEELLEIQKRMHQLNVDTNNTAESFANLTNAQDNLIARLREGQKDFGFLSEMDDDVANITNALEGLNGYKIDEEQVTTMAKLLGINRENFAVEFEKFNLKVKEVREARKLLSIDTQAAANANAINQAMGVSASVIAQNNVDISKETLAQLESEKGILDQMKDQEEIAKYELKILKEKLNLVNKEAELRKGLIDDAQRLQGGAMAGVVSATTAFDDKGEQDNFSKAGGAEKIQMLRDASQGMITELSKLGPEGELMASISSAAFNMTEAFAGAFEKIGQENFKMVDGIGLAVSAVQALGAIQAAQGKAAVANMDKQIAAEKKRDGQSAASLAKIAAMEKKKEQMQRKNFERDKKMKIASAVGSTAVGIMKAYEQGGTLGFITGSIIAGIGAMQIAAISSTSFDGGSSSVPNTPSKISVGNRNNTTDLAKSTSPSGELAYARGQSGYGNMSNYNSAFTGANYRAAGGNTAFMVGEQGPELFVPEKPGTIVPADETAAMSSAPVNVSFNINTIDATGVEDLLMTQRGNIIGMIRTAANAHGEAFLESVDDRAITMENN